jgi:hypothetical protein
MSGKNPGQFKDFNKTANDLLRKVFPSKTGVTTWGLELDLKPTKYASVTAKIVNAGESSVAEVGSEVNFSDFGVTFKGLFKTDKPTLEASWKVSDKLQLEGFSAKLHFDASSSTQTAGVSVAYDHQWATTNARVYVPVATQILDFSKPGAQDTRLDADFVFRHPDYKFVLGSQGKFSFAANGDRKVDEAVVSLGYRDGKALAATASYNQRRVEGKEDARSVTGVVVTQPGDTQYVAQVDYELGSKKTTGTVGLSYPLADGATLKTKFNTDKEIGIGYSNKISSGAVLDFGSLLRVNTKESKVAVDSGFSVNLKYTQ